MDRREFLSGTCLTLLAAGLAGASERRSSMPPDFADDVCRTPPSDGLQTVGTLVSGGSLVIAGTRLFKEGFLDELLPLYHRSTGRNAEMQGGGCDDGVTGVRLKTAHLGGVCCPVAGSPARGLRWLQVGSDMKVIVAHPSVKADRISSAQLRQVLTGELRNWRALGGSNQPIALVVSDHCPDYIEPVRQTLLHNQAIWSPQALVVKTDQKQLETVARFEHSIGVNSWILAEPFVKAGLLKVLELDGGLPTLADAATGRYKLTGPMNLIYREWSARTMAPFFDMLYSDSGREVLAKRLVPVSAAQAGYPPRMRV